MEHFFLEAVEHRLQGRISRAAKEGRVLDVDRERWDCELVELIYCREEYDSIPRSVALGLRLHDMDE
jgi:hypothetical protein